MSFPIVPLAMALAEFAPLIARWIGGEKSEKVAQQIVDSAKKITGESDPAKILQSMKADPKLVAQFQHAVLKMEHEREMAFFEDRKMRVPEIWLLFSPKNTMCGPILWLSPRQLV